MKLEQLQEELANDLVLDQTKLQYEAANNPILYSKWATKRSNIRKEMLKIESKKKVAHKRKLDYYSGRGDEVSMDRYERSEMKVVIMGDQEMIKLETSYEYWGILLEFCTSAMDAVKSRGFAIKNIIELRQYEGGK